MKRFCILSILVLLGLAVLLFVFRLQTTNYLFTKILQRAGAENIQLELSEINRNALIFSRVNCTINGNILSLRGGSFRWSRTALLKKRLDTIAIDTLAVQFAPKNQTPSKQAITLEQILTQVGEIRQQLPFRNLSIHHLTLTGPAAGLFSGRELSLRLEKQGLNLVGELALPERNLRMKMESPDENQWKISLNEPGQDDPFFSARLHQQEKQIRVKIKANLARLNRLTPLLPRPLPEMEGKLTGSLAFSVNETTADLALNIQQAVFSDITAESVRLSLHGRLDGSQKLHVEHHSTLEISGLQQKKTAVAALTIDLDGVLAPTDGRWQFSPDPETSIRAAGLQGPGLSLESVFIPSAMKFLFSGKKISLDLQPDWRIRITGLKANDLRVPEAELRPGHETRISAFLDPVLSWSVAPSDWQWSMGPVTRQELSIESDPISINIKQLTGTAQNRRVQLDLNSPHLGLKKKNTGLSLKNITASLSVDADRVTGKASFSPEYVSGTMAVRFSYNLNEKNAEAVISPEEPFTFSEMNPLSSIIDDWPLAFDLTGGQLQLNGSISRQQKQPVQVSLQAELSGGKGHYKEILFSGLTASQDLQLLPTIQSVKNGFVTIDTVETGIIVTDIAMETAFAPSPHGKIPKISIRDLSASLFGGTISDDLFVYDPQQPDVQSTILIKNIDLARLVTVQQVKGLEVTGHIEGSLPFFLDRNGLRVEGGTLQNTADGGLIHYTLAGNNGLKESPLTGYALKALEEFHYSLLSATAEYRPDGDLQVSLHLEGKSPKLDTNRPVHLNINTEQNILSLLKSLRYSKSLTDEIDKEVQQRYRDITP